MADTLLEHLVEELRQPRTRPMGTGLRGLDALLLGGLRQGDLVVLTGATGVGATTLMLGLARAAAVDRGIGTMFLAPWSSSRTVAARLVSAQALVPLSHVYAGDLTDFDADRLERHLPSLLSAPLELEVGWRTPVTAIRLHEVVQSWARRGEDGNGVLLLDDLDLLGPAAFPLILGLLPLIRDRISVVIRCRAAASGVGADVAALADTVLDLRRPELDDPHTPRVAEADLTMLKVRTGLPGTVRLILQGHYARFVEIDG